MGENIIRKERLKQIQQFIKQCETYKNTIPDPFAASRVAHLDKNPCITGDYYVNVIFKQSQSQNTSDPQSLKEFQTTHNRFC